MAGKPITAYDYLQKIKKIAASTQAARRRIENETPAQTIHRLSSALHIIIEYCEECQEKIGKGKDDG